MTAEDTTHRLLDAQAQYTQVAGNTIPDPRTVSSSNLSESGSTSSQRPEMSSEVATLNEKLVNAINRQTTLDETLAQTKQELEASKARIQQLEAEAKAHEERITSGQLLTKDAADRVSAKLLADLADERKQKGAVQQEKRGIEMELENLTASLFEEANKMVALANMERDAMAKKNQQLRDQIKDTELLLASQHDQLSELKSVMQHMSHDGSRDAVASPIDSTAPTSPVVGRDETNIAKLLEAMNLTSATSEGADISPAPSTSYTQLLKPVCRIDLPAYDDFRTLILTAIKSQPSSRVTSGTYGGLNVSGLSSLASATHSSRNGSSTSVNAAPNLNNSPGPPGSYSPTTEVKGPIPLKDTRFFKRLLTEDIEPALRLDLSPSISWLSRRSIISALVEGTMIVEPIPESHRNLYGKYTSCAMCGEVRKSNENPRTHRMRVNEGEGATKWALCLLCLEKVRGAGDLVSYVRMIRDGVVRCNDADEENEAWEELVRLRERLFWARMAGGVVPAFLKLEKNSPVVQNTSVEVKGASDRPKTPDLPRHDGGSSGSGSNTQDELDQQLESGLQRSVEAPKELPSTQPILKPPQTPPQSSKRESEGVLKVSIPGSFWGNQVNVLH
jgi:Rab guanine nucleotide exchange factor SEC2